MKTIVFDDEDLFITLGRVEDSNNDILIEQAALMLANFEKANICSFAKEHMNCFPKLVERVNDWLQNFTISIPPLQAFFLVKDFESEQNELGDIAVSLINLYSY